MAGNTTVLFMRDFRGFTGGHLKVHDYIRHTISYGGITPLIYLAPQCDERCSEPTIFSELDCLRVARPVAADAYFVAGEDWFLLDAADVDPGDRPVINLVQHVRHADLGSRLFNCLSRQALRLCVSHAVADAIRPFANGEVRVMPTGVAVPPLARKPMPASDIFIAGQKSPDLARRLAARLPDGVRVDLLCDHLPREAFLLRATAASVAIMLPMEREGFYLPPLEVMSYGVPVITTDCLGARDYCFDQVNCRVVAREPAALADAGCTLLHDSDMRRRLAAAGLATAGERTLDGERQAYFDVLRACLPGAAHS